MKTLFLGRLNNDDDRNCIYTEHVVFACGHYWSSIRNEGAAWSGGHPIRNISYDEITTGFSKEQWERVQKIDRCLDKLGYGIKVGDDRYKVGEALANEWNNMIDSIQNCDIEVEIMFDERERIMNEYKIFEDDLTEIFNHSNYRDFGVISAVYGSVFEFGEEEAFSFGIFHGNTDFKDVFDQCFDYGKFGEICLQGNDCAVKISDGRVVTLYG